MKKWMVPIILFLIAGGLIGGMIHISGIINIGASSGHWKITKFILDTGKARYVSTYSLLTKVPPLDDPGMLLRGAGHYEIGCRVCHGTTEEQGFLGKHTTAKAPFLPPVIPKYNDKELFRIIKHGIKFTGMPAWPALGRDDEVWDMVAFLKALPRLSQVDYENLVYGKSSPLLTEIKPLSGRSTNELLQSCANCHGVDGNGKGKGAFPKLAGQNYAYLKETLLAYRSGTRHSGTMELVAHGLKDEMIEAFSIFYSQKNRTSAVVDYANSNSLERGRQIANDGIPDQKVAACIGCHGPDKEGKTRKPYFPDLRGQPANYLVKQLRLFLEDKRGGTVHAKLMKNAVQKMTEEQMQDVSLYYESLKQVEER